MTEVSDLARRIAETVLKPYFDKDLASADNVSSAAEIVQLMMDIDKEERLMDFYNTRERRCE